MEKLAVFNGLRPHGEWVLGLYDNDVDDKKGEVLSFKLHFTVQECDSTVHWKEIQTLNLDERWEIYKYINSFPFSFFKLKHCYIANLFFFLFFFKNFF